MRVNTGSARGRKLEAPQGLETRPTSDMVKEAMFSIIQFEVEEAMVLDLFAGSGQLGIEALSRGAKFAVFVDASREAQEVIRANLQSTGLAQKSRVAAMDALGFLKSTGDRFSIALLDPPYQKGLLDEALPLLAGKMEEDGVILCESEKNEALPTKAGAFSLYKEYRYGKKKITVYRKEEA